MAGLRTAVALVVCLSLINLATVLSQTTTQAPEIPCSTYSNSSCEQCLKNVKCLWCNLNHQCIDYPVRSLVPPSSVCPLNSARWGLCWVNFQALIITMSVVAGIILISIIICCCCCCKCEKGGLAKMDAKMTRQSEQRKVRQAERKVEMQMRHDEIRQKYGLTKDNPYSKFENN
ncbi:PTTG1 interacting protein b [Amia ocellicauda]|uniref:PTTG1 interacting protein b n=1 Tax=Amia ocellicauda TaxID=2972642 RepID=UPI00346471EE